MIDDGMNAISSIDIFDNITFWSDIKRTYIGTLWICFEDDVLLFI